MDLQEFGEEHHRRTLVDPDVGDVTRQAESALVDLVQRQESRQGHASDEAGEVMDVVFDLIVEPFDDLEALVIGSF